MTHALEIAPGLNVRGFTPRMELDGFKLLAFGMDSALLYPGVEELVNACKAAGMAIDLSLGDATEGAEKLKLLHTACANLGIFPTQAVVVGHALSDLAIMGVAGLSVAFMAPPAVEVQAMVAIRTGGLDRLLTVITLAAASSPTALDLSVLETLVNHDPVKFRKFALLFITSIEAVLAEVDIAVTEDDLPLLMAMGHRAKSTARNIGAEAFANQCLELEQSARAQDRPAALHVAREMRPSFESIRLAIEQRLAILN